MTTTISGTTGITTNSLTATGNPAVTFSNSATLGAGDTTGFKNRIINGAMVIDQRNAGASVTPLDNSFLVDRFVYLSSQVSKFTAGQNLNAVTPPIGFSNYLGFQTLSAVSVGASDYFVTAQNIEGFNSTDLNWGTANAKTVTLSFQVYSSLTGTFGGVLKNNAATRTYPFSYTISTANTWTTVSITIAGDTSGTWVGATNGIGIRVQFGLGVGSTYSATAGAWATGNYISATGATSVVGTSSATFYLTGVQLEVGSTASSFDVRDYGRELILCQRYYEQSYSQGTIPAALTVAGAFEFAQQVAASSTQYGTSCKFSVAKRTAPTMTFYNWNAAGNQAVNINTGGVTSGLTTRALGESSFSTTCVTPAGTAVGQTLSMQFTASAEL